MAQTGADLLAACSLYGPFTQVAFIGEAEPAVQRVLAYDDTHVKEAEAELLTLAEERQRRFDGRDFTVDPSTDADREFEDRYTELKDRYEREKSRLPAPFEVVVVPMTVQQVFYGAPGSKVYVQSVRPDSHNPDTIVPGRSYLVFGSYRQSPDMVSPTQPPKDLELAEEDMRLLQLLELSPAGATIVGRVAYMKDKEDVPLADVAVHIGSPAFSEDAITGKDGMFVVRGVPANGGVIAPALPTGWGVISRHEDLADSEGWGCVPRRLYVGLNGRIRGTVSGPVGSRLDKTVLELIAVDRNDAGQRQQHPLTVFAGIDGTFEFIGLAPGTYVLATSGDVDAPGTPIYYPGTDDIAAATPIVVGEGTEHSGIDLQLPPNPESQVPSSSSEPRTASPELQATNP